MSAVKGRAASANAERLALDGASSARATYGPAHESYPTSIFNELTAPSCRLFRQRVWPSPCRVQGSQENFRKLERNKKLLTFAQRDLKPLPFSL